MDPRQRAIQQAMQGNQDPTIMGAIAEFARTGIPPTDPRAVAVLNQAFQANGLPLLAPAAASVPDIFATQAGDPANGAANAAAQAQVAGVTGSGSASPSGGSDPGREAPRATGSPGPGAGLPSSPPPGGPTSVLPGVPQAGAGGTSAGVSAPGLPGGSNAVNAVLNGNDSQQLRETLRMIGIDPDNLGLSGGAIAKTLLPFLQSFVKTDGLLPGSGNPTDNLGNRLNQFAGMFNGDKGFYGQLQDYGNQLVGGIGDKLAANNDVGMQKMYLDMINNLTNAGGNALTVSTAKQEGDKAIGAFGDAELQAARTGSARPNNYVKWLQGQTNPAFSDIIRMVTGGR